MFFLHLLLKIEPVRIFFKVLHWKLNTPVLWKHLFVIYCVQIYLVKYPDWLWSVGKNTLLSPKLMGYWSAHFSFYVLVDSEAGDELEGQSEADHWRGPAPVVEEKSRWSFTHPVSCCKTCRQALALSLHTAGYRSVYIAAFRPIRYPPQRAVGEATKPLTFPIVTHLLTFRLLLTVL